MACPRRAEGVLTTGRWSASAVNSARDTLGGAPLLYGQRSWGASRPPEPLRTEDPPTLEAPPNRYEQRIHPPSRPPATLRTGLSGDLRDPGRRSCAGRMPCRAWVAPHVKQRGINALLLPPSVPSASSVPSAIHSFSGSAIRAEVAS